MTTSVGEIAAAVLAATGALFTLVSAIGIVKMPDVYTRMHAASKSATLGAVCLLLAAAVHFGDGSLTIRIVLAIVFLFLTAPVAAHMLARAAYLSSAPLTEGSVADELTGRYDIARGTLRSGLEPEDDRAE